jgi:sugar lactone lactonase YvrE
VLSLQPDGTVVHRHVSSLVAALRPRARGGAVLAVERGFALEDAAGALTMLPEVWSDPGVRMNEGGCDPQGRFYCGSMAYERTPRRGAMFRLDADATVSQVLDGITISNGLDWSPDGGTAYHADTATRRVFAYDYDPLAGLQDRRTFVEIPEGTGAPDGLTVDAGGGVWVALYGGRAVHRYRPDGTLDGVVELPVSHVTACTFGGPELDRLYITTSRENLPPGAEPAAGAVFTCVPGVGGRPVLPYAG